MRVRIGRSAPEHYPFDAARRIRSSGGSAARPALEAQRALPHQHLEALHGPRSTRRGPLDQRRCGPRRRRDPRPRRAAPRRPGQRRRAPGPPLPSARGRRWCSSRAGRRLRALGRDVTPSSVASASARSGVRLSTDTSAPGLAQRPGHGARGAAGAQHQGAPARGDSAQRVQEARGVGVVGLDRAVREGQRVGRADGASRRGCGRRPGRARRPCAARSR